MPASIKVVSVFAVVLAATASGYFLLVPDDPPAISPDVPIELDVDVHSPTIENTQRQPPVDRAADGERSRDHGRQKSAPSGLIAESVRQAAKESPPSDSIVNDVDSENEPLWKRMVQSDSGIHSSAKGEVDLPMRPEEFVGPPLIENSPLAIAEDEDSTTTLVQREESESTEPMSASPPVVVPEKLATTPQRAVSPQFHVVKQGDTYQSIAKEWFGDETKWSRIAEANPKVDARRMQVGQRIVLPAKTMSSRVDRGRSIDKTNTYVVRSGDTLTRIAKQLWGDPAKWKELYQANRSMIGLSPDNLQVGMKLTVPSPRSSPRSTAGRT